MEKCPLSCNPYTYCPVMFKHADDFILAKVETVAEETKRLLSTGREIDIPRMIDRYCGEITAYMNGRIHEILKLIPKEV